MANEERKDLNPGYWDEYTNLQHVKHAIIRDYLNGWIPKLGFSSRRIVYIDTHAGRGKHKDGNLGSPLVALQTFLGHSFRDKILSECEVVFSFVEIDADNVAQLKAEVTALGTLPSKLKVEAISEDCFDLFQQLVDSFKESGQTFAPAFIFVDPYGFKVPARVLKALLEFPRVEVFVNLMWRELDMAICRGRKDNWGVDLLNEVFDGESWREIDSESFDERANQAIDLLRGQFKVKWTSSIKMLGDNAATRYVLVHYSNHDAGRDLMKDCLWKLCPDGNFYASKGDNPRQQLLLSNDPDLSELTEIVVARIRRSPCRWAELADIVRPLIWRGVHLNQVVRQLRKDGILRGSAYEGLFVPGNNPLLTLC